MFFVAWMWESFSPPQGSMYVQRHSSVGLHWYLPQIYIQTSVIRYKASVPQRGSTLWHLQQWRAASHHTRSHTAVAADAVKTRTRILNEIQVCQNFTFWASAYWIAAFLVKAYYTEPNRDSGVVPDVKFWQTWTSFYINIWVLCNNLSGEYVKLLPNCLREWNLIKKYFKSYYNIVV